MPSELPRILLVDDEPGVHRAVALRLRSSAEVVSADTPEGALALARSEPFDLALVDVNLGEGVRGTRLIPLLRELDADLAAIVFTGNSGYAAVRESLEAHSFDFISKSPEDDGKFLAKIREGVAQTRLQRSRTRSGMSAPVLEAALAEAVVARELEAAARDIQRTWMEESLDSFSAVLGRAELLNEMLRGKAGQPMKLPAAAVSNEVVAGMLDYVERLRENYAEPGFGPASINTLLTQAERILEDAADRSHRCRIERSRLRPDWRFGGDARPLLRAVVILLRILRDASPPGATVKVGSAVVPQPWEELRHLGSRSWARVICPAELQKDAPPALAVSLSAADARLTIEQSAALFRSSDILPRESSPWCVSALLARLNAALAAEAPPQGGLCYRIIVGL
jgi:DNA-binding NarL/FixJ family response regulator